MIQIVGTVIWYLWIASFVLGVYTIFRERRMRRLETFIDAVERAFNRTFETRKVDLPLEGEKQLNLKGLGGPHVFLHMDGSRLRIVINVANAKAARIIGEKGLIDVIDEKGAVVYKALRADYWFLYALYHLPCRGMAGSHKLRLKIKWC